MPAPRCPACSRAHARSHVFCPYCGTPLKLQPELKQVSVLFADLCDSTRLIAGRSPEGAQQFLQQALDLMQTSIEAFGGTLSQDRGDGVVAVFGAPRAQEDHALRAALAALQMQRAAQAKGLTLRIGLHSGEALVKVVADSSGAFRGIDGLVWALIFVSAVGLGPFAGVLAIAVGDVMVLGKLFAEAIENVDKKPVEGVQAAGGSSPHIVRLGVFPQVFPVMMSHVLYFFESNVRSATILGIVGAGGIGLQLSDRMRINNWQEAAFIILMILVTVAIIDNICRRIRARIIEAGRA